MYEFCNNDNNIIKSYIALSGLLTLNLNAELFGLAYTTMLKCLQIIRYVATELVTSLKTHLTPKRCKIGTFLRAIHRA